MQLPELTDKELVEGIRKGDARVFELIYDRYWRIIYSFAYRHLGSKEESEEIIHDLMLSLWTNREVSEIQTLKVYLLISARNLVNKHIRSQLNLRKYLDYQVLHELSEHIDRYDLLDEDHLKKAIDKIMNDMPEKTATIFRMSKLEELPVKAIAEEMGLSAKAVEYHITKSMRLIRKQIGRFHSNN